MNDNPLNPSVLWETYSWPELEALLQQVDTVLLPCGAIEQHGPHLPVDIDYFDARLLAQKVAEACAPPRPLVLLKRRPTSVPIKEQSLTQISFTPPDISLPTTKPPWA